MKPSKKIKKENLKVYKTPEAKKTKNYIPETLELTQGFANIHIKYDEIRGVRLVDHEPYLDGFIDPIIETRIPH